MSSSSEDYYFDENGLMVFTAHYLLNRGYCCQNGCRHCPYRDPSVKDPDQRTVQSLKERPQKLSLKE